MTPLLLLHGALGSAAQFDSLKTLLPEDREVYAPNFPGHGGAPEDVVLGDRTIQILGVLWGVVFVAGVYAS